MIARTLAAFALLAACGGGDGGDGDHADSGPGGGALDGGGGDGDGGTGAGDAGGPGGDGDSYRTFAAAHDVAICDRLLRCSDLPPYPSIDACLADYIGLEDPAMHARVAASIDAGRTSYDADQAATCLAVEGGSCELDAFDLIEACDGIYAGLQIEGAPCLGMFECSDEGAEILDCYTDECQLLLGTEEPAGDGTCVVEPTGC